MVSLILTPPTQLHHIHVLRPQHTLIHCLPLLLDSKPTLVPEYLFFFFFFWKGTVFEIFILEDSSGQEMQLSFRKDRIQQLLEGPS